MNSERVVPKDLDEAVDYLLSLIHKDDRHLDILEPYEGNERGFIGQMHMFVGMNLRNAWCLWWHPNHPFKGQWPDEAPPLIKWFEERKIYHGDDRSGIILTTVYRKYFNLPIDLEGQIQKYHDHWMKNLGTIEIYPKAKY